MEPATRIAHARPTGGVKLENSRRAVDPRLTPKAPGLEPGEGAVYSSKTVGYEEWRMDDLERVFVLVRALPKEYQADAVMRLGWLIKRADEEMTMTEEQRAKLEELDRLRSKKMYDEARELLELLERRLSRGKKPPQ